MYVAAQAASDERTLISWYRLEGTNGDGVWRYCGGGGWRPRGSGRDGRPWCGGGSPELDEDDRRGYRDQADSHEERQPVAGDQGAVGGAGTGVGDGGQHGEPGGGTDLLCGDEQAACDALLAGRARSRPSGSRLSAFAAGQYP